AAQQGVPHVYEGWIFGDVYSNNAFCVIASEIDPALKVGEKLDDRVSFDGYFFKRYRYKAADTWRDAPLLIGRVIRSRESLAAVPEPPWSFSRLALPGFLSVIVGTMILCIGLTWWFRRGDRRVRDRMDKFREATFVDPTTSASEWFDSARTSEPPPKID